MAIPYTTAGRLQIAAARGLGGLGATEGPPVTCDWTTAGLVPQLLPWLAILALLALTPNRGWSAWWIWLPVAGVAAGCHWLQQVAQGSPADRSGEALAMLLQVPIALGFGLAALWLLAPYLGHSHRCRSFFGILAVLVVSVVFTFAARVGWGLGLEPVASLLDPRHCAATANVGVMALPFLVPLTLSAPGLAADHGFMRAGLRRAPRFVPALPVAFRVPADSLGSSVGAGLWSLEDCLARQRGICTVPRGRAAPGGGHFRELAAVSGPFVGQSVFP